MNVFIDTAAFLAVLNANDQFHLSAKKIWDEILSSDVALFSSNYVLLETISLLQRRFGIEAIRLFESDILPVIEINWVDEIIHNQAKSALLVANRRLLSLVDCTSFEIMRQSGINVAFTFDNHFQEQGFKIMPTQQAQGK
jgi:predicted nucleic acid-binding protein